jgi:hypothetical protein
MPRPILARVTVRPEGSARRRAARNGCRYAKDAHTVSKWRPLPRVGIVCTRWHPLVSVGTGWHALASVNTLPTFLNS